MNKKPVSLYIRDYLVERRGEWVYGGTLERVVSDLAQAKPSNISRTLRKLEEEGKIQKQYVANPNGSGIKVVQYRAKPLPILPSAFPTPKVDNLMKIEQKSLFE